MKAKEPLPLYWAWIDMRRRCQNPAHYKFRDYGGRGIRVCEEWDSFAAFRSWALANGWRQGLQIDRRENDGNYEPSNCRFVTSRVNCNNRRDNVRLTVTLGLEDWSHLTGLPIYALRQRIRAGWEPERIVLQAHQEKQGRAA